MAGNRHHGSQRQHPCHSRFGVNNRYKGIMLDFLGSQFLLHYSVDGGTIFWPQNEIPWLRGLIIFMFLQPGPDITNWIGVLPAREDGQSCDHCEYAKPFISDKVTKLSIAVNCVTHKFTTVWHSQSSDSSQVSSQRDSNYRYPQKSDAGWSSLLGWASLFHWQSPVLVLDWFGRRNNPLR